MWRRNAYIALDESLKAREIGVMVATVIRSLLSNSDDYGKVVFPSWATIGSQMQRSERTAGVWLARAREAGWVERQHRWRRNPDGTVTGLSNLWRVRLPDVVAKRVADRHTQAGRKPGPTAKAPQNTRRLVRRDPAVEVGDRAAAAARLHREREGDAADLRARADAEETPVSVAEARELREAARRAGGQRAGP